MTGPSWREGLFPYDVHSGPAVQDVYTGPCPVYPGDLGLPTSVTRYPVLVPRSTDLGTPDWYPPSSDLRSSDSGYRIPEALPPSAESQITSK